MTLLLHFLDVLIANLPFSEDELVTLLVASYIFQNDSVDYFLNPVNLFEITPYIFDIIPSFVMTP